MKNRVKAHLYLLVCFTFLSSACTSAATPAPEESSAPPQAEGLTSFDWKRFNGQEIVVLMNEHGWTNGLRPYLQEFTAKTGIKVDLQAFAEDVYYDKMEFALRSEKPSR